MYLFICVPYCIDKVLRKLNLQLKLKSFEALIELLFFFYKQAMSKFMTS